MSINGSKGCESNNWKKGPYDGHPSWKHWNVSLWIAGDEELYRTAVDLIETHGLDNAAIMLTLILPPKTPDGATYAYEVIRYAIEDLVADPPDIAAYGKDS